MQELVQFKLKISDLLEFIKEKLYQIKDAEESDKDDIINEVLMVVDYELSGKGTPNKDLMADPDNSFLSRLRKVHPTLTYGQERICQLVFMGLSYKESSSILNVSPKTVENRIYCVSRKIKPEEYKNLRHYLLNI